MLTFGEFTGINNIIPEHRQGMSDLVVAMNVDIGRTGEITRRGGFTEVSALCHKNLWQARGFMLATRGSKLTAIHPDATEHIIHPAIGPERLWFCNLPDGRTTFSNGLIHGVTDGVAGLERTVPTPTSNGAASVGFGNLDKGTYRYCLTHVRLADRAESVPTESVAVEITSGGLTLDGLPELDGHETLVYLSSHDGEGMYLAGVAVGGTLEFAGKNTQLVLPCRTLNARPVPVGTITAHWRGRVLTAVGDVLWASRPQAPHLSDWRDFRPMGARITAIQPVSGGVYVGTDDDLIWLGGETFESLAWRATKLGPVVLGSGVPVPGDQIRAGEGTGNGEAMICIAGGEVVAGFDGGQAVSLTQGRYRTTVQEVSATFREVNGIPQYVAVAQ